MSATSREVAKPGDYATLDLKRDSILVMRGKDETLRAFMNVCRHRAAKLLDGTGNCRARITCPYHGWSYDLSGELKGIPAEKTFPGVEKDKLGLKEIEFEILSGLVFARVIPGGPTLRETFGEMADIIDSYRLEEMVPAGKTWTETWDCNWKIAVDNNLENYHITIGHPGLNRMLDSDLTGVINEHGVAYSKSVLKGIPSANRAERMYQHLAKDAFTAAARGSAQDLDLLLAGPEYRPRHLSGQLRHLPDPADERRDLRHALSDLCPPRQPGGQPRSEGDAVAQCPHQPPGRRRGPGTVRAGPDSAWARTAMSRGRFPITSMRW